MRLSTGMKVGLVSLFTCLALLLGQLSSMSMASAHTANTFRSAHISSMNQRRGNFEHEGIFFDPANFGFTNSGSIILYHHDDKPIR